MWSYDEAEDVWKVRWDVRGRQITLFGGWQHVNENEIADRRPRLENGCSLVVWVGDDQGSEATDQVLQNEKYASMTLDDDVTTHKKEEEKPQSGGKVELGHGVLTCSNAQLLALSIVDSGEELCCAVPIITTVPDSQPTSSSNVSISRAGSAALVLLFVIPPECDIELPTPEKGGIAFQLFPMTGVLGEWRTNPSTYNLQRGNFTISVQVEAEVSPKLDTGSGRRLSPPSVYQPDPYQITGSRQGWNNDAASRPWVAP
ncbi:hypothetical protein BU24DRAFT_414638 [Aaosphaeria arxii CBS 175.79]|uniref:Uncharacterized protein n=1 Tax=Aaosphaeria arxii CBS 175.79 TaxID=1450172 RepID=A0A6A5XBQ7_9PLEO|nr:uncharacterized protein BU24DRAFT_414638 [Aaosphaeria arxii CBS 175.79]KAF2010214.1 hypothetical protein BU24DRAFT_414638 [Aaosphaeria arxii CBS 175.79]